MRKRYRVLLLAALVAALAVPVGFALSLEPDLRATTSSRHRPVATTVQTAVAIPALTRASESAVSSVLSTVPEGARLFLVGTMLFGLAAVVRRSL